MPRSGSTEHDPLPGPPARLRRRLREWFTAAARDLPWRRRRSLYGTWIAEVMLQQTTVATVARRWEEFLARFPDVATLAAATEEEVLAAWSGLGYYGRARRLHAAARHLVTTGGGLPRTAAAWRGLPGIGPYTAAAVASLGAGDPVAAVDTNVRRVLTRLCCATEAAAAAFRPADVGRAADLLLDRRDPGTWNEALMELGALVCRAGDPGCGACPWRSTCRAAAAGNTARVPVPRRRSAVTSLLLSALLLLRDGTVGLLPPGTVPFPVAGGGEPPAAPALANLWPGLWGLPLTAPLPLPVDPREHGRWVHRLARQWRDRVTAGRTEGAVPEVLTTVRQPVTRYRLEVTVFSWEVSGPDPLPGIRWFPLPLPRSVPVSALTRKATAPAAAAV